MLKPLKIGIIGANWTLTHHAPAWRLLPGVEVAAICTAHKETAEAAAAKAGIPKAYWNVEEMVADPDLDIIDVGTKPSQRYDMVVSALNHGKHVYNCLPFAVDSGKADHMADLARQKGLVGVVDAQWRWAPAIRRMKELIDEGAIGDFFTATIHLQLPLYDVNGHVYTMCSYSENTQPYYWLSDSTSGASAWRNFGSHTILNLMYLFGAVDEIVGVQETFVKHMNLPDGTELHPDTADFGLALVKFRKRGLANINVSWAMADAPGYYLEVCGSKGRLVARDSITGFCDTPTTLYQGDASIGMLGANGGMVDIPDRLYEVEGTTFSKTSPQIFTGPLAALFSDMVGAIRDGGREGSPSFAEAAHAHRAVEAAVRSMTTKSWEKVDG
jgi:predicted dehydrogenase